MTMTTEGRKLLQQGALPDGGGKPGNARVLRDLIVRRELGITIVAIVMFIYFSLAAEGFLTVVNLLDVARVMAYVAIVGVGMTFLFIAGELDLSVGAVYGLSSIVVAWLVSSRGFDLWAAVSVVLVLGIIIGLVNGAVTTIIGVPSFIVTIGMLSAVRGAALVLSGAFPIALPFTMHSSFFSIAGGTVGVMPAQVLWMVGVLLAGAVILRFTVFGYHVYATGGNQRAASQSGINTVGVKVSCFVLTGVLAALVGALQVGWLHSASPSTGTGFELQVIGAVIIGGTALFGGEGSVVGTLIGAWILAMLADGLILLGLSTDAFLIFTGLIIVLAAVLDVVLRRKDIRILNPFRLGQGFATRVAATSPKESSRKEK